MSNHGFLSAAVEEELVAFAQELIRIKSLSGQEGEVVQFIEEENGGAWL